MDAIFYSPIDWGDTGVILNEREVDYDRPRGVFAEPSRFAIFQSILLSTILFLNYRFKEIKLKSYDFFLGVTAILLSTSLFGAFASIILLTQYLFYKSIKFISRYKLTTVNLFSIFFLITIVVIFFIFFDAQLEYVKSRFMNVIAFSDGSTRARIIGGYLSFIDVLQNQPISGYGAGNFNQQINMDESIIIEKYSTIAGNVVLNNTTFLSAMSIASGIIPVLFLFSIFIYTLIKRYYYYSLIMFLTTVVSGLYYYPAFWISLVIFCYYVKGKKIH